ncbi:MAG: 30S ribosomal protein S12 methylthiotransferase RimO [Bacilli bacterium]|nr:30S ribosomal protein S12 methylthiotransferase RimO [Bacilli bacterium]
MNDKLKIGLVSLGCAKNLIDSEMMLGMFDKELFDLTDDPSVADLIIVNTCGFIDSAKEESIATIMEMAQYGAKVAVTGCLVERYFEDLKEALKEADCLVPIRNYGDLHKLLKELLNVKEGIAPLNPLVRVISTKPYSAYLRISEGCNNFCSFCAIPYIRGRFVSRPFDEIIEEAKILIEKGVKEVSLISQDTTRYGFDFKGHRPNVVDLLKELEKLGFYSIRLLYLYPSEISDELIDTIANSKVISHYFDVPVQCASDKMLKAMRRHANKKETMALFHKIKERCPDAILRTTFIAGFPGESKKDHEETLAMMEEIGFDHVGAFAYSKEEGTASYDFPHQVRPSTKKKRQDEIYSLQMKISYSKNKNRVGEVMEGLVVGYENKSDLYLLRSTWNAPDDIDGAIRFKAKTKHKEGDIVKVRITNAFVYDLLGEEA